MCANYIFFLFKINLYTQNVSRPSGYIAFSLNKDDFFPEIQHLFCSDSLFYAENNNNNNRKLMVLTWHEEAHVKKCNGQVTPAVSNGVCHWPLNLPLSCLPVSSRLMIKKLRKVVKGISIKKNLHRLEWWVKSSKNKIRDNFKFYTWIKKSTRKKYGLSSQKKLV